MIYDWIISPFADYSFMRRALVACFALSLGAAPIGVFMMLRRMALIGDAMTHAILPGAALAFLFAGASVWPMTLGGLIAGLLVALGAGCISRFTTLKEDSSFMGMYLISLSAGVMIISVNGSAIDLLHVLFGNILAVDNASLILIASIATISVVTLAVIYRPLIIECFDPAFLRSQNGKGAWYHQLFLVLIVLNLVAAFQAIGTLMALGIILLPAIAARFWVQSVDTIIPLSIGFACLASMSGLLLSYHFSLPSGPSVVLVAGALYMLSVLLGTRESVRLRFFPHKHFATT